MLTTYYFDPGIQAAVSVYTGFLKPDVFREIALGTLAVLEEHNANKILADTSGLKVMPQENQQWLDEVWFPKAKELHVRYIAFLVPADVFGKMSMEQSNKAAIQENMINIKYFEDIIEAKLWLRQQQ
ncbi:hypothetical protein [Pontibacter ruber]|uniref:STAS/SEC14 domain-containing protein n=1 Tax=Pontibacter ruber TaxID=1343895 RepID=A0ABW5D1W3_9BACT|nr:hypothetical protein [Pontibacter ruber]